MVARVLMFRQFVLRLWQSSIFTPHMADLTELDLEAIEHLLDSLKREQTRLAASQQSLVQVEQHMQAQCRPIPAPQERMVLSLPEFDDTRNDLLARLSALDNTLESVSLGGAVR